MNPCTKQYGSDVSGIAVAACSSAVVCEVACDGGFSLYETLVATMRHRSAIAEVSFLIFAVRMSM